MVSAPTSTHNKARPRRKEEGGRRRNAAEAPRSTRSGRGGLGDRHGLVGILERPQHLAVNVLVSREDAAGFDHVVASVKIGDETAGFAHQRDSRRHVPRRQPALPIGIEAAGRHPGEIERGGPEPPQSGDPLLHRDMFVAREFHVAAAGMRERAGDDRVGQPLARRHPQPLIVEEGALAALGGEQLVIGGVVDDAGDHGAFALEPDRDRKVRNSVQKIQRAVERIDDPAVSLIAAFARATLLAQKTVAGARMLELVAQDLLGAAVGGGDEIGRPLERRLQVLDLAEIALERAARLARGLDHHVEKGGAEHGGPRSGGDGPTVGPKSPSRVGSACRQRSRQERDARNSLSASTQGFAAFSPAARMSGGCCCTKASSGTSLTPPALAMMCHLIACTGLGFAPRPAARMLARRFCAIGLPLRAAFDNSTAARCSFLATPVPLNSAMAYSTWASVLSASEAAAKSRAASTKSFGTPRPSLYRVASAYCASAFPTCAALRKSSAARAKSCGNNWPSM